MAANFQLTSKATGEAEPLQLIDDRMREAFNAPQDLDNWYENWYSTIGLAFALGRTRAEILDWLLTNYDVSSWGS